MSKIQLGTVPKPSDKVTRDAVHVCVCTAMAHENISPGEQVKLYAMAGPVPLVRPITKTSRINTDILGVADPFFPYPQIEKGTLFYILIWPGSTTNLRHEWDHPQLLVKPVKSPKIEMADDMDDDDDDDEYDECQGCNG